MVSVTLLNLAWQFSDRERGHFSDATWKNKEIIIDLSAFLKTSIKLENKSNLLISVLLLHFHEKYMNNREANNPFMCYYR